MKRVKSSLLALLTVMSSGLVITTTSQSARADSSCTALLANKVQQANNSHYYVIEMTMHREDINFVTYSKGYLAPNLDGSFSGHSNQLFSDRRTQSGQPFDENQADQLDLSLSQTGILYIYYHPWNFSTTTDMSCKGSLLTTYIPNSGVITLTFRDMLAMDSSNNLPPQCRAFPYKCPPD